MASKNMSWGEGKQGIRSLAVWPERLALMKCNSRHLTLLESRGSPILAQYVQVARKVSVGMQD